MRNHLIDLDQLRVAIPDPTKRLVWLLGATTATMRGLTDATLDATEATARMAEAIKQEER